VRRILRLDSDIDKYLHLTVSLRGTLERTDIMRERRSYVGGIYREAR
jgi:hypothetical protein